LIPFKPDFLIDSKNGSIAMLYSRQERGSPCLTPLLTLNGFVWHPFIHIDVLAFEYRFWSLLMVLFEKLYVLRTCHMLYKPNSLVPSGRWYASE
jgi:hypothetical protein